MGLKKGSFNLKKVVLSSRDDYKISIVKNRYNYDINFIDIINIVSSIHDDALKKDMIDTLINDGYTGNRLIDAICSFKDDSYKDFFIKNCVDYNITNDYAIKIANSMEIDGVKNLLFNHTLYSFTDRDLTKIICAIDDDEYKKGILASYEYYCLDKEDLANIIASFKDDIYKEHVIEINSYGFDSYCKSCIIDSISDCNYKFNIVINHSKYKLDSTDVSYIISSFENHSLYVYDILENYRKYDFDLEVLASVVSLLPEDEKEKVILDNIYDFPPFLLCEVVKSFKCDEKRDELLNELYLTGFFGKIDYDKKICLPSDMSIGIEIESEGRRSNFVDKDIVPSGWDIHIETSLNRGTEVVSPILYSGDESQIIRVCLLLKSFKQEVNATCAGHIHIGADYFNDDVECFKTLLELFANMERVMFIISNEEGKIPRRKVFMYANPITSRIIDAVKNEHIDFDDINDMDSFIENMHLIQKMAYKTRYSSINFENMWKGTKNTIEFRIPNGTINSNVWIDNINLFGGLLCASKRIVDAKRKTATDINNDDVLAMYCYEHIMNNDISDRDKLICLLNLFPKGIKNTIYLNRYDVNSELIKGLETDEVLEGISSFRPIKITNYDIVNDLDSKKLIRSR